MTKIDLITGILGSGKTTFIRSYARYLINKGMKIAILENDFGAVNVDMILLQDLKCDNCQLEMISGCGDPNCHKRRFKTQLISLGMQHFDRIIMEPSGIFDMDEFFDTLYESPLDRWFEIGSIITIADSGMEDILSEQMEYLLASEASCCGKLVLSKLNTESEEQTRQISEHILEHINRSLAGIQCGRKFSMNDIIAKNWGNFTEDDYEAFLSAGYRSSSYVKQFSSETIQSKAHYFMHIHIPEDKIKPVIEGIMSDSECGKIFRIKGALPSDSGKWLKINATSERTEISDVQNGQSVLIVIGDDIDRKRIDDYLKKYNDDDEYVSI